MFLFLYHFIWTVGGIVLFPAVALLRILSAGGSVCSVAGTRLSDRLAQRLPAPLPETGKLWIHALSVGEVMSALPLVDRLSEEFPDKDMVFSATTSAGIALARERLDGKVMAVIPMPVDAWWALRKVIHVLRPTIFILIETDVWPGLLGILRQKGVCSILVNGRISPRTLSSYVKAPFVVRRMFDPLHVCLMQSDLDRQRLLHVGLNRRKVVTAGNIKFDRPMDPMDPGERLAWHKALALAPEHPVWVAGSTHPGEEEILLNVFGRLRNSFPSLRLVLGPRDIDRAGRIAARVRAMGVSVVRKTQIPTRGFQRGDARTDAGSQQGAFDVVILDTMGELGRVYGVGHVCFVGGSLVPVGGHNLLEPAGFGVPVIFGPHTHNFVSMSESLLASGGGYRVRDENELYEITRMLLTDERVRTCTGDRARAFVEKNRGALDRVITHVKGCLTHRIESREKREPTGA